MDKVFALLDLYKSFLNATSRDDLNFKIVNQSKNVVDYRRLILLARQDNQFSACTISGNSSIDGDGPFAQWLKSLASELINKNGEKVIHLDSAVLSAEDAAHLEEWCARHVILIAVPSGSEGAFDHYLWLERDTEFQDPEITILDEIAQIAGRALALQNPQPTFSVFQNIGKWRRYKKFIAIALIALFFLPVKLSATGPAEIVARNTRIVTAPFEGVLTDISIQPGATVKAGDIIARMDAETLKAKEQTALEALNSAQAKLDRVSRESLTAPERKTDLQNLRSEIDALKIEYDYTKQLLGRSTIKADRDGVAIFSDNNALSGKPVRTGDRIMMIANPDDAELLIRIPASSILPFQI